MRETVRFVDVACVYCNLSSYLRIVLDIDILLHCIVDKFNNWVNLTNNVYLFLARNGGKVVKF